MSKTEIEAIDNLAHQVRNAARAICPLDAVHGEDATGGAVGSLAEAVMGVTAGLCRIADAINRLADVQEQNIP